MNLYDISVFLREHNNYEILTHNYPDGDTLGSGYALCIALQQLGKNARVITANSSILKRVLRRRILPPTTS